MKNLKYELNCLKCKKSIGILTILIFFFTELRMVWASFLLKIIVTKVKIFFVGNLINT